MIAILSLSSPILTTQQLSRNQREGTQRRQGAKEARAKSRGLAALVPSHPGQTTQGKEAG